MAVHYLYTPATGTAIILCLSSDTKPTNVVDGTTLFEQNTAKVFLRTGGAWVEQLNAAYATTPVNLATSVTGDLPYANLTQAGAASRLLGRGSAAGAGDWQDISLGTNLSMSGTTLNGPSTRTRNVFLPATRFNGTIFMLGTPPTALPVIQCIDGGSTYFATLFRVPIDRTGGGDYKFVFSQNGTGTNDIMWRIYYKTLVVGTTDFTTAGTEEDMLTPAGGTADVLQESAGGGPSLDAGTYVKIVGARIGAHASDTFTDTVHFHGILFTYTAAL